MLFLKEIRYRKINFILGTFGILIAVSIVVFFFMMTDASRNETRRLTRDMGFNLKIIPLETNMNDFWINGYANQTMPENYVSKLVESKSFYYAHLTATLHKRIKWKNKDVVLTGISPDELETHGSKKSKMIFAVEPNKIYVGFEIARDLEINEEDKLFILGKEYLVERILSEVGSEDDIHIYFDLKELQMLLKLNGRINEILALNCLCSTEGDDPLGALRTQLEKVLPKAKVIMNRTIAIARERQRKMVDNYFNTLLPVILIGCLLWVGAFSMINVNQRKIEIGIMRAIGFGKWKISKMFIIRAFLIGLIGAILGFIFATLLGMKYGTEVFLVTSRSVKPVLSLLTWSIFMGPLFSILASLVPIVFAIKQEPAEVLKNAV